jgi:hypothetical protein
MLSPTYLESIILITQIDIRGNLTYSIMIEY